MIVNQDQRRRIDPKSPCQYPPRIDSDIGYGANMQNLIANEVILGVEEKHTKTFAAPMANAGTEIIDQINRVSK